ncbi:MAG TPA: primosomal protein N' [Nitrospiraceae bacterium]|nr:primosomal protein N' [Nitrospiraceae bacterium]
MSETTSPSVDQPKSSSRIRSIFVDVVIPRHLNRPFTYKVPARLQTRLEIGSRVLVPFGAIRLQGIAVSLSTHFISDRAQNHVGPDRLTTARLREVIDLLDESSESSLPPDLLTLSRMISERYLAPLGQCLRLMLPPVPLRTRVRYTLTDSGRALLDSPEQLERLSTYGRMAVSRLARRSKGLSGAALRHALRGSFATTLSALTRKGLVQLIDEPDSIDRARHNDVSHAPPAVCRPALSLSEPSDHAAIPVPEEMRTIRAAIAEGRHACAVWQTSAHQCWDHLMHAVEWTFRQKRTVLIITPEIARAEALVARFKSYGVEQVELFHGGLSPTVRAGLWSRIRQGLVGLIVGTRSAIFCPLASVGLICIEDEHDPSLKEEAEPRYHVREVAALRAQQHQAVLLLISPHPSLETLSGHGERGDEALMTSNHREGWFGSPRIPRPNIRLVDLRYEPHDTILSQPMLEGIQAALDAQSRVVLFLNRKGFASALWCRDCGTSLQCSRCSIALTFYKQAGRLTCHYCGTSLPLPDACPSCLAAKLEPVGAGTEHAEALIRRLFPHAATGRLDRDMSRSQIEATRRRVVSGEIDILIGTQMLFQGDSLPPAGFVGLIHADAGLHLPDFRAGERTFHTLMDAVMMASGETAGQVVLQTYLPTHHAIAAVAEHTPAIFYEQESSFRRLLAYPPYAHLISLRVTGRHEDRVRHAAEQWASQLRRVATQTVPASVAGARDGGSEVVVLGPVPSAMARLRGRYRWQLLVKSPCAEAARTTVRLTLDDLERVRGRADLKYEIDVDPIAMI